MRLIRYNDPNSRPKQGCLENDLVYDLIGDPLQEVKKGDLIGAFSSVSLLAPCCPSKVIAIAINYAGIDGYSKTMLEPMVFIKPSTCVCNPGDVIINPFPDLPWWGEPELAVVIKRTLRYATFPQAQQGILGFTIGNDVTVENIEGRDHHLARSKCPDSFCPLGPWIDTEFDASDCEIEAIQNRVAVRRGRSSQQFWQWPQILVWLSSWMTLEPWDVVLTGNPPDIAGMRYLQDDDIFTARIAGLGELTNYFKIKTARRC